MKKILILIPMFILAACTASNVKIKATATDIKIGTGSPGKGYEQLGAITAKHGGGCGLYGAEGNFEGAVNILRNKADVMGADYIQIIRQQGEHMTGLCLDRSYVIDGIAYKQISDTISSETNSYQQSEIPSQSYRQSRPISKGVIESQVDGDFEGFEGETIIKLLNGQVWQQSEYWYHYHYSFMPKVTIFRSGGGYKMIVDGIDKAVGVVPLN